MTNTMKNDLREELVPCRCGRSPSGYCIGLHNMTEEQWLSHMNDKFREGITGDDADEEYA